MRISDWSSDVCSSDLLPRVRRQDPVPVELHQPDHSCTHISDLDLVQAIRRTTMACKRKVAVLRPCIERTAGGQTDIVAENGPRFRRDDVFHHDTRSEEHTSELQSLMRISYAVFCLK